MLACTVIDFDRDGFNVPTTPGQVIDTEFANLGLLISSDSAAHPPLIFDSANPTGGDDDLGTPNEDFGGPGVGDGGDLGSPGENDTAQGRILIIQETVGGVPDDNRFGGTLTFSFDRDVKITEIPLIDIEEPTFVRLFDENDNVIATVNAQKLGDNSFQLLQINVDGVRRFEIVAAGSLGIPFIEFCDSDEPPPPPPGEDLHGRMTGGGSIFLPAGAIGGSEGTRVTHGFQLHCAHPPETINNRLQINWGKPSNRFHLLTLTEVECFDTPLIQAPPDAPIDTLVGVGIGRFSGKFNGVSYQKASAQIEFTLTDAGEPGVNDTSDYRITVLDGNNNGVANDPVVVLDTNGPQLIDRGNHQAHNEIPRLTTAAANVDNTIDSVFLAMDTANINDQKSWQKAQELLALFAQFEVANNPTRVTAPGGATAGGSTPSKKISHSVIDQLNDPSEEIVTTSAKRRK